MDFDLTYADKVGLMLINLKLYEVFNISEKVKPENINIFVATVKSYIDCNTGHEENWEIIFSNDYSLCFLVILTPSGLASATSRDSRYDRSKPEKRPWQNCKSIKSRT